MTEVKIRLSKAAKEFNVGVNTIVEFLKKKGYTIDPSPNTKLEEDMYTLVANEFQSDKNMKKESEKISLEVISQPKSGTPETEQPLNTDTHNDYVVIKGNILPPDSKPAQQEPPKPAAEKVDTAPKPVIPTIPAETQKSTTTVKPVVEEKIETAIPEKDIAQPAAAAAAVTIPEPPAKEEKVVTPTAEPQDIVKTEQPKQQAPKAEEKIIEVPKQEEIKVEEKKPEKVEDKKEKVIKAEETQQPKADSVPEKKHKSAEKHEHKNVAMAENTENGEKAENKVAPKAAEKQETATPKTTEKAQDKTRNSTTVQTQQPAQAPAQAQAQAQVQVQTNTSVDGKATNFLETKVDRLKGPVILGKIELQPPTPPASKDKKRNQNNNADSNQKKGKRQRIQKDANGVIKKDSPTDAANKDKDKSLNKKNHQGKKKKDFKKVEITDEEIQKQVSETLKNLEHKEKSKAAKRRKIKREAKDEEIRRQSEAELAEKSTIKVTEFVTVNELANLMNVNVTEVIRTCMNLGVIVSINQRLDAETITVVADEFGFDVDFVGAELHEPKEEVIENEEDRVTRNPIVTVMGHVDHGKTSLLDNIRKTNVIAGEAGGITQHIGAYEVVLPNGRKITFLDTPGHEAFTAMRARGAQLTDIAIIVIAADDKVMPQTVEAINHAQAANVPIVIAINKIDKPGAHPEKIKEELAAMRILVEDWGGDYQCQEISAKKGVNLDLLLEKVLLVADLLDLKGNPQKRAEGTVIESALDKGRGYVAKILVQDGTLHQGDMVLAGTCYGKVKALFNERNQKVSECGPSTPVLLLGLNGATQAGDNFVVLKDEHEAKSIATKRQQLQREMGIRTQKHITLDEIGRRIAIGDFKELNIIVKADVDGSIEALSDSLLKLSTPEVQVNVIHKSVGQITENDVMLASASDAIIVGFQVRPSLAARKLAEQEQIDIRTYSVIYKAIDEIKDAIEGMLSPEIEEKVTCNVEIREVFKISKVGSVAGCMVQSGTITRNNTIRLIRDGIVVYTGKLGSLKRFKDDAKEVKAGYECGLNIDNFNDIKVGDIIEGYIEIEHQRKL